MMMMIIINY